MDIGAQLTQQMKDAMRARDKRKLDLIRMIKSKMGEKTTSKGFSGEVDDALWVQVISAYGKSLKKAREQFEAAGEAGLSHIEQIDYELEYVEEFLPKKADEATTQAWVDAAIAGLGGKENARFGAVMGSIMKAHRSEADANLLKDLINQALA